jgi:MFS family permease
VAKGKRGFAQGITHAAARIGNASAPIVIVAVMASAGWRMAFFACAGLSFAWVLLWMVTFTERPQDHPRITAEELSLLPPPDVARPLVPWGRLARRMAPVVIVYFCYGWNLWLFLTWIPQYFLHSFDLNLSKSALFASSVFLAGVVGDLLGGLVTDRILKATGSLAKARSAMVAVCMMLSALSLLPLMFTHNLTVSVICLSAGFFFAEMVIGPMWAVPMDIAQELSGTASGMMNTGSALAAIISPVVGGFIIDMSGNWELPFLGTIGLMALGALLSFRMAPERRFSFAP